MEISCELWGAPGQVWVAALPAAELIAVLEAALTSLSATPTRLAPAHLL